MVFSGYMSPEYAMDGVFSMKSDIYSFGVLVLEIITGRRNRGFYEEELDLNLLRYVSTTTVSSTICMLFLSEHFYLTMLVWSFVLVQAWMMWKEGRSVDLVDTVMDGSGVNYSEVLRCIQVALLCVEVQPRNRPLMSSVVMMLASENATVPEPNEPGVNIGNKNTSDTDSSHGLTANSVTITAIEAR